MFTRKYAWLPKHDLHLRCGHLVPGDQNLTICGRSSHPRQRTTSVRVAGKQEAENIPNKHESASTSKIMQNKLEKLSKQLEKEEDPAKQQELIKTIDSLISVIDKLNKK